MIITRTLPKAGVATNLTDRPSHGGLKRETSARKVSRDACSSVRFPKNQSPGEGGMVGGCRTTVGIRVEAERRER